jgi:hypothetical protein
MSDETHPSSGSTVRISGAVVLLLILLAGVAAYSFHVRNVAKGLAAQNNEITSALNATRGQIEALTAKINDLSATQASNKPAASQPTIHPVTRHPKHHDRAEDPRWKQLRDQLAEQQKQIDSTRQDLGSTRTELQGSIARTHDELVVLQKKGERSYYEFDVDKSGQFARNGPMGVRLRKANTKHEYADLELMVDDYKVSKKHVNIYEPVVFYAGDARQPVELVINNISKNHIHGYVSEPKYRQTDLEAMAAGSVTNSSAQPAQNPASTPPQRRKLELPTN